MAKLPLKEGPLRLLIATSFGMFAWASRDIVQRCKEFERTAPRDLPSRSVRPWISHGLMLGCPRGSEMIQVGKGMGGEMWNTFLILVDKLDVDVTAPASCAWFV